MTVEDLLTKTNAELSDEELELKIAVLSKMRITKEAETDEGDDEEGTDVQMIGKKAPRIKSNLSKRVDDLFNKMSPEQLAKLDALLGTKGGK